MNWMKWVILAWLVVLVVMNISLVGKPCKTHTAAIGICALLQGVVIAALVVYA